MFMQISIKTTGWTCTIQSVFEVRVFFPNAERLLLIDGASITMALTLQNVFRDSTQEGFLINYDSAYVQSFAAGFSVEVSC